jgi:hypothetical protein
VMPSAVETDSDTAMLTQFCRGLRPFSVPTAAREA